MIEQLQNHVFHVLLKGGIDPSTLYTNISGKPICVREFILHMTLFEEPQVSILDQEEEAINTLCNIMLHTDFGFDTDKMDDIAMMLLEFENYELFDKLIEKYPLDTHFDMDSIWDRLQNQGLNREILKKIYKYL